MSHLDPRIQRGLVRQFQSRTQQLSAGQQPFGWKAGFGSSAAMAKFDLEGPVMGFLTDASIIEAGSEIDVSGWSRPVAEPELAVYLGSELRDNATEASARQAIVALGPAIELADVHPPPEEVEEVLANNVFHRALVLGPPDQTRQGADLAGLIARVRVNATMAATTADLEAATGRVVSVVRRIASLLSTQGEHLRAGDVIICGSVVPPVDLASGDHVEFELSPFPPISVTARGAR